MARVGQGNLRGIGRDGREYYDSDERRHGLDRYGIRLAKRNRQGNNDKNEKRKQGNNLISLATALNEEINDGIWDQWTAKNEIRKDIDWHRGKRKALPTHDIFFFLLSRGVLGAKDFMVCSCFFFVAGCFRSDCFYDAMRKWATKREKETKIANSGKIPCFDSIRIYTLFHFHEPWGFGIGIKLLFF